MKPIAIIVLVLCTFIEAFPQEFTHVTYEADDSTFPNPERGIYHHKEVRSSSYTNLLEDDLLRYRSEGATLIMRVFYLESFVNSDISSEYIQNMHNDFAIARATGMKLLVRFAYTMKTTRPVGDAEPAWVLAHIDQLKDVLRKNSDVIALVQAGFIGAWGEWYYTDHFSDFGGAMNEQNWLDRGAVANALLDALPSDRIVQLRTPQYKRRITGASEPLTAAEAFSGSAKARLGHHNDCFLASANDLGTYVVNIEEEKNYIEDDTQFVPLGGETCGVNVPRSECPTALSELERFHWSYLNVDYHPLVIDGFETSGCMPEIERKLGYRYRLIQGLFQTTGSPSGELKIELEINNDGWANPYNPRDVEFILRNTVTSKEYVFVTNEDPRKWSLTDATQIEATVGLPEDIEEGQYSLHVNLPDPRTSLYGNPNYSIRLANQELWDEATGYNALDAVVDVAHGNGGTVHSGSNYFTARYAVNASFQPSPLHATASATKVLLYWGIGEDDGYRVIERSIDGAPYATITKVDGAQTHFIDTEVEAGTEYQYRYYFQEKNVVSSSTPVSNVTTNDQNADFETFVSDGEGEEWNVVPPLATRYVNAKTFSFRLFADRDNLNVFIEGAINKSYSVFLNTDETETTGITNGAWAESGFDYAVRNDSLFEANNAQWNFVAKVTSGLGETGLEVSVPLGSLHNIGTNLRIKAATLLDISGSSLALPMLGKDLAIFLRSLPAQAPQSLTVTNSEAMPESRLVVEWNSDCLQCKNSVLERSDNPETGFAEIFRSPSVRIYRDDNLEIDKTYYYRAYSFNETGPSDYTSVISATTNSSVTGIEDPDTNVKVYPVPVDNILTIQTEGHISSISIHDAVGRQYPTAALQRDGAGNTVKTDVSVLPPGVYIIFIASEDKLYHRRIIKE